MAVSATSQDERDMLAQVVQVSADAIDIASPLGGCRFAVTLAAAPVRRPGEQIA